MGIDAQPLQIVGRVSDAAVGGRGQGMEDASPKAGGRFDDMQDGVIGDTPVIEGGGLVVRHSICCENWSRGQEEIRFVWGILVWR